MVYLTHLLTLKPKLISYSLHCNVFTSLSLETLLSSVILCAICIHPLVYTYMSYMYIIYMYMYMCIHNTPKEQK